jgi:hypothetical protein
MLSHTSETPGCNIKQSLVDGKLFIRKHILKARISLRKWDIEQSIFYSANYKKRKKKPLYFYERSIKCYRTTTDNYKNFIPTITHALLWCSLSFGCYCLDQAIESYPFLRSHLEPATASPSAAYPYS